MKKQVIYYKEQRDKLIIFLLSQRFTKTQIANVLGVTRQAIAIQFPGDLS